MSEESDRKLIENQDDRVKRAQGAKARNRTLLTGGVIASIALVMAVLVYVASQRSHRFAPPSNVAEAPIATNAPKLHENPAAAVQMQTQNSEQVRRAANQGQSYMPRPVIASSSSTSVGTSTAVVGTGITPGNSTNTQPPPPPHYPPSSPTQPPPSLEPQSGMTTVSQEYTQALTKEMSTVINAQAPDPPGEVALLPATAVEKVASVNTTRSTAATTHAVATATSQSPVKIGDLFYATMDTTVNTDVPGPVMATIDEGPAKNARVIGAFTRSHDVLSLKFTQLVLADGTHYGITGYAVDPQTSQTAVASAVDHHYLSRWGGLIAAAFIQGYGQAIANSGATVTTSVGPNGTTTTQTNGNYTTKQATEIAGGVAAGQLMNAAQQNFNRPPTVTLVVGSGLGVLITEVHGGAQ